MYVCRYVCMYVLIFVSSYVFMYVCMHACNWRMYVTSACMKYKLDEM